MLEPLPSKSHGDFQTVTDDGWCDNLVLRYFLHEFVHRFLVEHDGVLKCLTGTALRPLLCSLLGTLVEVLHLALLGRLLGVLPSLLWWHRCGSLLRRKETWSFITSSDKLKYSYRKVRGNNEGRGTIVCALGV